jgi:hypothetical protein
MMKIILLASCAVVCLVAAGCGHSDSNPGQPLVQANGTACADPIMARDNTSRVFVEDLVDGQAGEIRLVDVVEFVLAQSSDGKKAAVAGHIQVSPKADPEHVTAYQEILCSDVAQFPDGDVSARADAPFIIDRSSGAIARNLVSEYLVYGANTGYRNTMNFSSESAYGKNLKDAASHNDPGVTWTLYRVNSDTFEVHMTASNNSGDGGVMNIHLKLTFKQIAQP